MLGQDRIKIRSEIQPLFLNVLISRDFESPELADIERPALEGSLPISRPTIFRLKT
jgi:hypothetical protein